MSYNGWTDWETWNTNLWIDNEEGLQLEAVEIAERHRESAYDAGHALKEWWEGLFDPTERGDAAFPGPVQDAWSAHLSTVNWTEIAEHIIAELEPADEPELSESELRVMDGNR